MGISRIPPLRIGAIRWRLDMRIDDMRTNLAMNTRVPLDFEAMTIKPIRAIICTLGVLMATISVLEIGGCTAPLARTHDVIEIDRAEYSRVYNAAIMVLREQGFPIDRQDFRFGVITTKPISSPTILEPWNTSNRTMGLAMESTINEQQRRVRVTLEPQGEIGGSAYVESEAESSRHHFIMRVEAQIERRQQPVGYLTRSTAGHRVLRMTKKNPHEYAHRGIPGSYWQPIGRDPYLEQHLTAAIIRKAMLVEFDRPDPEAG